MKKQTLRGLIFERLDFYENQILRGIKQDQFVDDLKNEGIEITLVHFRKLLSNARKKREVLNNDSKFIKKEFIQKEEIKQTSQENEIKESNTFDFNSLTQLDIKKLV